MEIWKYGLGITALLLVIWAIKSEHQTRVMVSAAVIVGMVVYATRKNR